ncbi:hypothetical protein PILCRDRAFT_827334 [Piloderma croceum F 1598]|uniref:Uncharacterized protein n=1 Tax=Piloderma croceum (strain F 1598) TaxID=765440 RepID=A0A0C3F662_PILCF|nr:hypothetical protein PILCRDRAFT_827334 [Piloderma croceum F 1598]
MPDQPETAPPVEEKQCRICLDGPDTTLGRLIRPCLCKGSMTYVHVGCLKRWRDSSASKNFFACPVCHYKYRLGRTRVVGIATNPVVVGALSSVVFTIIVFLSSYITTYFMSALDEPSWSSNSYFYSYYYISPWDVGKDLIRAALRILKDENSFAFDEETLFTQSTPKVNVPPFVARAPPGILKRFLKRFILGLPVVGAGSLVQMMLSLPFLGPVHWLARYRGNRSRRGDSRDVAAMVVIVLLLVSAARALYKVYEFTQRLTQRILLRAEDAILEVN